MSIQEILLGAIVVLLSMIATTLLLQGLLRREDLQRLYDSFSLLVIPIFLLPALVALTSMGAYSIAINYGLGVYALPIAILAFIVSAILSIFLFFLAEEFIKFPIKFPSNPLKGFDFAKGLAIIGLLLVVSFALISIFH